LRIAKSHVAQDSDWRKGFLFVGNQLALDFLNTRPVIEGAAKELLPDFDALLRWFEVAGVLDHRVAVTLRRTWAASAEAERVVQQIRSWRENLRTQVAAWISGSALTSSTQQQLNRLMQQHPMLTRFKTSGNQASTELWFDPHSPEDLFAPLAQAAASLFAHLDRTRVRQCGNCVLFFYDTSKKGTRKWCSMRLCGNRLKVAAYTERKRSEE